MRYQKGLGGAPCFDRDSVNHFRFGGGGNQTRDIVSNQSTSNVSGNAQAFTDDAPTNGAIRFDGDIIRTQPIPSSAAALIAEHTGSVTFQCFSPPSFEGPGAEKVTIAGFQFPTGQSGTPARNTLFRVSLEGHPVSGNRLIFEWNTGTGVLRFATFFVGPRMGEMMQVSWSWVPTAAGLGLFTLYINGDPQTPTSSNAGLISGATNELIMPTNGEDGAWVFGGAMIGSAPSQQAACNIVDASLWKRALTHSELLQNANRLYAFGYSTWVADKIVVDSDGDRLTDLDLSNHIDQNWLKSISFSGGIRKSASSANAELFLERGGLSIAPLIKNNAINFQNNLLDEDSFLPGLRKDAKCDCLTQIVPFGLEPVAKRWWDYMPGWISRVLERKDTIQLTIVSAEYPYMETEAEQEIKNIDILPEAKDKPEKQPSYGLENGQPAQDLAQAIFNDNDNSQTNYSAPSPTPYFSYRPRTGSYEPVEVYFPARINSSTRPYRQKKEKVMSIHARIALQLAARARYMHRAGQWRFCYEQPLRAQGSSVLALAADDIQEIGQLDARAQGAVNVLQVTYLSSEANVFPALPVFEGAVFSPFTTISAWEKTATFTLDGTNYRLFVTWYDQDGEDEDQLAHVIIENLDELALYFRRYGSIAHAATEQIHQLQTAFEMCLRSLKDIQVGQAMIGMSMPQNPLLEENDVLTLGPMPRHISQSSRVAIIDWTRENRDGEGSTKIRVAPEPMNNGSVSALLSRNDGPPSTIDHPHDALTPTQRVPTQGLVRKIIDDQAPDRGRFLQIRNSGFEAMTAGKLNEPDGWHVENNQARKHIFDIGATWQPQVTQWGEGWTTREVRQSGALASQSGKRSVVIPGAAFSGNTGRLVSEMHAFEGRNEGENVTTYGVEVHWRRPQPIPVSAALDETRLGVRIDLDWYLTNDEASLLGRTSVCFDSRDELSAGVMPAMLVFRRGKNSGEYIDFDSPGTGPLDDPQLPALPRYNPTGLVPPSLARFFKVAITQIAGGAMPEELLLDFVQVFRKSQECRVRGSFIGNFQPNQPTAAGAWMNIDFYKSADYLNSGANTQSSVFNDNEFDHGGCIQQFNLLSYPASPQRGLLGPGLLNTPRASAAGVYVFSCEATISGSTLNPEPSGLRVVKMSATSDTTAVFNEVGTQVFAPLEPTAGGWEPAPAPGPIAKRYSVYGTIRLEEGDRLLFQYHYHNDADSIIALAGENAPTLTFKLLEIP